MGRGEQDFRGARSATAALFASSVMGVALAVTGAAGCANDPAGQLDAGVRPDAPVVEAGLVFEDAAGDSGSSGSDAAARDAGWSLCRGTCDPVTAMGCGRELCLVRGETAECVPSTGRGMRASPCSTGEDCAPGLACFDDGAGAGVCDRVCCPGAGDCAAGETCAGDGRLVDGTTSSWGRCFAPRPCALLDPMACLAREACYVVGPMGETECLLAGAALEGEACSVPNDCASGLVCAGAFMRTCAVLCQLTTGDDSCPGPATCVRQAYTPEGIGVCVAASALP